MSYTIFYRPMFLKVKGDMFIPIFEGGDNNVWECDNKRRARSWYNARYKGMQSVFCSENKLIEILNNIHEEVKHDNENYSDKNFGYFESMSIYGKSPYTTSWNDFLNFYKKGIRNAITVEEAKVLKISITVSYCDLNNKHISNNVNTEEELFNMILKAYEDSKYDIWIGYSSISDRVYDFVNILKSKNINSGKWFIETQKGCVKSFDGFNPIFTNNRNEAMTFTNKNAGKIGSLLLNDNNHWCSCVENR